MKLFGVLLYFDCILASEDARITVATQEVPRLICFLHFVVVKPFLLMFQPPSDLERSCPFYIQFQMFLISSQQFLKQINFNTSNVKLC